jgi:hypothetical protein
MYYDNQASKIASFLKNTGVKVNSFSEGDETVDGEIRLDVPYRQVFIQICPYYSERGLVVDETIGTGKDLRILTLKTFSLSENGANQMAAFIKKLQ